MEALRCVRGSDLEPNFDVVVRVRPYDEVNVVPIGQQASFDVSDSLRQILTIDLP